MCIQTSTTQIVIADDHSLVRTGLRSLFESEPDMSVVGEAADGVQAARLALELHPDVVVSDLEMPGQDGLAVVRQVLQYLPATRILMVTVSEDGAAMREALQAGAAGYVTKRASPEDLVTAVRTVAGGGTFIDPYLAQQTAAVLFANAVVAAPGPDALSDEEKSVLRLLALGHTTREIAEALSVCEAKVASLRADLQDKLGLHTRVALLRYAKAEGLVG
jgi:DNA-binding NarL/FixJ family response regulator